jgi:type 1 glutamine amidotransferase
MKTFRHLFSRRAMLRGAGMMTGGSLLGLSQAEGSEGQTADRRRALALIGDRYHNADYIRVSLDRVFTELGIPIDYTIEYSQISAAMLKRYQIFLILRDGMIWPNGYLGPDAYAAYEANLESPKSFPDPKPEYWISEEQSAAIMEFVSQGNGFYALHNCSNISLSPHGKKYREVMGGAYIGHPPLRPFRIQATKNAHPITQGMRPFVVNDEQHYVVYDKNPEHVLLEAENIDGLTFQDLGTKSVAGWAYDFGKGRVVFTAAGHTIHAMWNPQYVEIQKRAIRWLLKEL